MVLCATLAHWQQASAQTQVYFDTNGTTAGSASTGVTWAATAGAYWSTNVNGTTFTPVVWNSVSGATTAKNATFSAGTNATGAYTVTVSGIVDYVGGLTFEEGSVTLASGTLNLRQTSIVNVIASQATISSTISSTSSPFGLTKTGVGTLFLSGANTYTGPTAIQAGTLSINSLRNVSGGSSALGAPTTTANGTIKIGNTTTSATLAYTGAAATTNRVVDLAGTTGGATLDASGTGALTFASAFTATGAGSKTLTLTGSNTGANTIAANNGIVNNSGTNRTALLKSGTGQWVIAASNSFTGGTQISNGTLKLGNAGALGVAANTLRLSGGTLDLATDTSVNAYVTTVDADSTILSNKATASSAGITHALGSLSIGANILSIAAGSNVAANSNYGVSFQATSFTGNATFDVANNGAGTGTLTLGALNITGSGIGTKIGDGTLLLGSAASAWASGVQLVINNGTIQVGATNAAGSVALGGVPNITVNATSPGTTANFGLSNSVSQSIGTLTFGGAGGASTSTNTVTLGTGATLTLGGTVSFDPAAINPFGSTISGGTLNLGTANRTFSINNSSGASVDLAVSSLIAGTAGVGVLKTGAGSLLLTNAANTYSGVTTISQGTISVGANSPNGANGALGNASSAVVINDAGTGSNNTALTIATSGVTVGRAFNITNNGTGVTTLGGDLTLLSGTGSFTGNIALNKAISLQSAGTANITFGTGVLSGTGAITKTGSGTVTLAGTNTYSGTTTISQGTFAVAGAAPSGSAGALGNATSAVLINDAATGANNTALTIATSGVTVGRAVTVANNGSGTTTIGGAASLTSGTGAFTGNISLGRGATFQAAGTSEISFTGTISGAGVLTKADTGTVTLTAANTFTGGVIVNAGTLRGEGTTDVGGFTAFGSYAALSPVRDVITVNNGATLEVFSTYTGDVGNGTTNSFKNLVLNGSGVNGGGALRSTGGNSTWTGNTVLNSNATITNAGGTGDANELFIGAYVGSTDTNVNLNGNTLTINGDGNTFITSKVGATAGDTGSVIINGGTSNTTVTYFGYANYYTGTTTINSGRLVSAIEPISGKNAAVRGDLIIGSNSLTTTATFTETFLEQIADTAQVTINSDGTFDLATTTVADTIGSLVMKGGTVTTGAGELNIANGSGIVDVLTSNTSTIAGRFHFLGATGTINVDTGSTLLMSAKLLGNNIVKSGDGKMILTSNNVTNSGYIGTTSITGGTLNIQNSSALGSVTNGTSVSNGATLQLENTSGNVQVGSESLTLNGAGYAGQGALNSKAGSDNVYGGAITLGSSSTIKTDAGNLTVIGSITGTAATSTTQTLTVGGSGDTTLAGAVFNGSAGGTLAMTKVDSGTVTMTGASAFTGAIAVNAGTLNVAGNNSLGSQTNAVNVASGATFAVSGGTVDAPYTNTIRTLTGSGLVSIAGSTTLKVNTPSADTFDGRLTGTGLFEKAGAGTFTFSSTANTSAFNFAGTVQLTAAQYVTATDTFTDGIGGKLEFKGGSSGNALTIGTLNLTGGTLLLTNAYINIGTLNITGNTVLDFGDPTTSTSSILNANNIYIAAGAVLTIKNWNSEVDFLFANSDFRQTNGGGTLAVHNAIGSAPENQVWFKGDPQSPDGSQTTWIDNATNYYSYADNQIRPVPEPGTYGILLLSGSLGLVAWARLRKRVRPPR